MNGQQRTVIWIGLILVALNLVKNWAQVRDVIFNGAGIGAGIAPPSSSSGGGGFTIPDPFHQFPGGTFLPPTITIPTSKKTK